MGTQDSVTFTFRDASKELSSVRIPLAAASAANFDAQLVAIGALELGILDLSRGVLAKRKITTREAIVSNDAPTDPDAQGELKFLVTYESVVSHKKFQIEIPCADSTIIPLGTDLLPLDLDALDFVTAFEAVAKTPDVANDAVAVLSIRVVGRNR